MQQPRDIDHRPLHLMDFMPTLVGLTGARYPSTYQGHAILPMEGESFEDVLLGSSVSLVVGLLLWPRGATAALGTALAEAYADSARYLAGAVQYGVSRCDRCAHSVSACASASAVQRPWS